MAKCTVVLHQSIRWPSVCIHLSGQEQALRAILWDDVTAEVPQAFFDYWQWQWQSEKAHSKPQPASASFPGSSEVNENLPSLSAVILQQGPQRVGVLGVNQAHAALLPRLRFCMHAWIDACMWHHAACMWHQQGAWIEISSSQCRQTCAPLTISPKYMHTKRGR